MLKGRSPRNNTCLGAGPGRTLLIEADPSIAVGQESEMAAVRGPHRHVLVRRRQGESRCHAAIQFHRPDVPRACLRIQASDSKPLPVGGKRRIAVVTRRTHGCQAPAAAIEPDQLRLVDPSVGQDASLRDGKCAAATPGGALDLIGDRDRFSRHAKAASIEGPRQQGVAEHVQQIARRRVHNLRVAAEQADAIARPHRRQVRDPVMFGLGAAREKEEVAAIGEEARESCVRSRHAMSQEW